KKKHRKPESGQLWEDAVGNTKNGENDEANGEIYESGKNGRNGKNEAREIDPRDEMLTLDDHVSAGRKRGGEVGPGDEGGEVEHGVREAVGRKFGEPTEEQGEYQH